MNFIVNVFLRKNGMVPVSTFRGTRVKTFDLITSIILFGI